MTNRNHDSGTSNHVLIVEPSPSGHRFDYVRVLATAAIARGDDVTVATSVDGRQSSQAKLFLSAVEGRVDVLAISGFDVMQVQDLSRALDADVTVVPDGDRFVAPLARQLGWRGAGTISILCMRKTVGRPSWRHLGDLVRTLGKRALIHGVALLPSTRVRILTSSLASPRTGGLAVPDPIEFETAISRTEIRQRWGMEADRFYFAVIGSITPRKNVELVASAAARLPQDANVGLVVAGVWSGESHQERERLQALSRAGTSVDVIVHDGLLPSAELDALIGGVDCVVLAHSNEGPSGILGKASAAGTRVISAGARSLKEDARIRPDLMIWVDLDENRIAEAMSQVRTRPAPAARGASTSGFADRLIYGG